MKTNHVEIMVEEPSMDAFLSLLLPKLLAKDITYSIHAYQGKPDLLRKLQNRLRGYSKFIPGDWRIVVIIDEDRENCMELKQKLESASTSAGLFTKSNPRSDGAFHVINRLAVEELEAWYFGDVKALCKAYPGIPSTLDSKAKYRNPDAITGGTWEQLENILNKANYHKGGLSKIQAAQDIAIHMDPNINRSRSFRVFRDALLELNA